MFDDMSIQDDDVSDRSDSLTIIGVLQPQRLQRLKHPIPCSSAEKVSSTMYTVAVLLIDVHLPRS